MSSLPHGITSVLQSVVPRSSSTLHDLCSIVIPSCPHSQHFEAVRLSLQQPKRLASFKPGQVTAHYPLANDAPFEPLDDSVLLEMAAASTGPAQPRTIPPSSPSNPYLHSTPSTSSSTQQSYSSLYSLSGPTKAMATPAKEPCPTPLPSPTQHQPGQFFASIQARASAPATASSPGTPTGSSRIRKKSPKGPPAYRIHKTAGPETTNLMRDSTLVAEAAKRAQMAVLARDMEGVEL